MISSQAPIEASDVASHYDELDYFYRKAWGNHLHHGLWHSQNDKATIAEATLRLLEEVTEPLDLTDGNKIADIGCGYGACAHWVANRHRAHVLGLTISQRQVEIAKQAQLPTKGTVEISQQDWLNNTIADHSLDAAYSIESLAHMPDKEAFFRQLKRTLKPGAHAAISCWLASPAPHFLERALLRAICREGKLPHLGTNTDYTSLAQSQGLEVLETRDLSTAVERTWWLIGGKVLKGFFTDGKYFRFFLSRLFRQRLYIFTIPRLLLAYRTGAIRYGIIYLKNPS